MIGRSVVEDTAPAPTETAWPAEDWWSVLLGMGAVTAATIAFTSGSSLEWFAVSPRAWSNVSELLAQCAQDGCRYAALGAVLLVLFTGAATMMGFRPVSFAAGFAVVYLLSVVILTATAWRNALQLYLETPLIALVLGLILSNVMRLPDWLMTGLRAEFYIKIGVVLIGAALPWPVIVLAGPIAIAQASIGSIVTFFVIYRVARFLDLDKRLAAMLAAGGSICGLSAVIAIAGAVRARRQDISVATTIVIGWALAMIVLLPLLARAWYLSAGVGGAWIGSSEYADAAGFAAAQTFGGFARDGSIGGTPDQALWSYTLVKIVGRDMWIGIWVVALSLIAITRWEPSETGGQVDLAQIWSRFPKFILGFFLASLLITWAGQDQSLTDFDTVTRPRLLAPIDTLRNWAFTFSFLSIGASLRIRRLAPVTGNAFVAFSVGVVVNLIVGFILSAVVFQSYWTGITR
jgi:uncharacterized membrane protein YadS